MGQVTRDEHPGAFYATRLRQEWLGATPLFFLGRKRTFHGVEKYNMLSNVLHNIDDKGSGKNAADFFWGAIRDGYRIVLPCSKPADKKTARGRGMFLKATKATEALNGGRSASNRGRPPTPCSSPARTHRTIARPTAKNCARKAKGQDYRHQGDPRHPLSPPPHHADPTAPTNPGVTRPRSPLAKGKRAGKPPLAPLYTVNDAFDCLKYFSPVSYGEKLEICPGVEARFNDAGHILGSSIIELSLTEDGKTVRMAFSGDLGQPDQPLIKDPTAIDAADYIVMESTYGNRRHEDYDRGEALAAIINQTVKRGGNIVIPAFAVGRTQTIVYYLHKLLRENKIPDIPVFIDSPLAISATDIFGHHIEDFDVEAYDMLYNQNDNPSACAPHLHPHGGRVQGH
jgi:hypothetical protein